MATEALDQPIPWQSLREGDRVRVTFEATVKYMSQHQANLHFEAHKEPESWSAFSKELLDTATITRIEKPVDGATAAATDQEIAEEAARIVGKTVRPDGEGWSGGARRVALQLRATGWRPEPKVDPDLVLARKAALSAGLFTLEGRKRVESGDDDKGVMVQSALRAIKLVRGEGT